MDSTGPEPDARTVVDRVDGRSRRRLVSGAAIGLAVFLAIAVQVWGTGPILRLDSSVMNHLDGALRGRPELVRVIEAVTILGDTLGLTVIMAIAIGILVSVGRNRPAILLGAAWAGQLILGTLVKDLVQRPRPVLEHPLSSADGPGFPSSHTLGAVVAYGALWIAFTPRMGRGWRRFGAGLAVLFVVAVGSSRVLLGAHFPSDVVAALASGTAWLALVTLVVDRPTALGSIGASPEPGANPDGPAT